MKDFHSIRYSFVVCHLSKGMLLFVVCLFLACHSPISVVAAQPQSFVRLAGDLTSEQIRDAANGVMLQKDFRGVQRRVLENVQTPEREQGFLRRTIGQMGTAIGGFVDWIFNGLFSSRGGPVRRAATPPLVPTPASSSAGGGFDLGKSLLCLGLAVLLGVTVWLIAAIMKTANPNRKPCRNELLDGNDAVGELKVPPGEMAASTYESRAIQMASIGNYRAALRELLVGSMSWIERAGLIRFRKGLTNRDYVRAVWKKDDQRIAYTSTALEFERVYFGRREATSEMFENCLKSFQGSFREEETTTANV